MTPGKFYRFPGHGKRSSNRAAWAMLFPDERGGVFGDFSTGLDEDWQAERSRPMTPAEREAQREQWERAKAEKEAAREQAQEDAAEEAAKLWGLGQPATEHPYLSRKGVRPHGTRVHGDTLLVPMRDAAGKLWNVQRIAPDGTKRFLPSARVAGCYFTIGKPAGTICFVEGFADGASVHEATGHAVAVAFTVGNLEAVAVGLRTKYADLAFVVCADDDYATPGNPGVSGALIVARAVRGLVALPDFGPVRTEGAKDFNDVHQQQGAEAVERAVANAKPPEAWEGAVGGGTASPGDCWPSPQPWEAERDATAYPLDALPDGVREAVREAVDFLQCPPALAGCSALSALSLAGQGLADVKRDEGLTGPTSLYFLAIAESGERKTTCDKLFLDGVRLWEAEREDATRDEAARNRADMAAWESRREGILAAIKQASRKGADTTEDEAALFACERERPAQFRVPRLIRTDATPEALAWQLANGWPVGGIMSSEAGLVLGGHGMSRDSQLRNMALLNQLWDGTPFRVERRGEGGTFTLSGARLTMGLAAQPEAVRYFMEATKGLARGSGFAARFLIAAPVSTQGTRLYKQAEKQPAVMRFSGRLLELLRGVPNPNVAQAPAIPLLEFDTEAFKAWRRFHDDVERELRPAGELAEVPDVASKAADNTARLAALFHVYRHGAEGRIQADEVLQAAAVVGWHLFQARAFLSAVAAPRHVNNARKLDAWLLDRCRMLSVGGVERRDAQRLGPVRDGAELDMALQQLAEARRVRVGEAGKRLIVVNPALLRGQP